MNHFVTSPLSKKRCCRWYYKEYNGFKPITMNAFDVLMTRAKQKIIFKGNVTLAQTYDAHVVNGWYWSEKLDGVRAIWNGKELVTRNGNTIYCPSSWTAIFPKDIALDGELYIGIGKFNDTVSTVRTNTPDNKRWSLVKFHVFDTPTVDAEYNTRIRHVFESTRHIPMIVFVPQYPLENPIPKILKLIESKGGEGIMLRNPKAPYIQGRTDQLLKVKSL